MVMHGKAGVCVDLPKSPPIPEDGCEDLILGCPVICRILASFWQLNLFLNARACGSAVQDVHKCTALAHMQIICTAVHTIVLGPRALWHAHARDLLHQTSPHHVILKMYGVP